MYLSPSLPRLLPAADQELETIEYFVACDPYELEEELAGPEFLSMCAGAILGGLGFEALHHLIEGAEHIGELQDAMRPVIQRQQLTDAINAFKRNPRSFAPGEVKGVWVRIQVPRQRLLQLVMATAPSRQPQLTVPAAPAPVRRSLPPRHRPLMKLVPAFARV